MITKFTSNLFPNTHVEFCPEGVKLVVSLNITPSMRHHLSPSNVFKADKFFIYSIKKLVKNPNAETMRVAYNQLMSQAMIRCRDAKIAVIEEEKKIIARQSIFE